MVEYATTPPQLPQTFENSHGMRFWQATVLQTLGDKYKISNWTESSKLFKQSGEQIISLCEAALGQDRHRVSTILRQIADLEEKAYGLLKDVD
jgi:hypothetical protein